jgi:hypothetical protein
MRDLDYQPPGTQCLVEAAQFLLPAAFDPVGSHAPCTWEIPRLLVYTVGEMLVEEVGPCRTLHSPGELLRTRPLPAIECLHQLREDSGGLLAGGSDLRGGRGHSLAESIWLKPDGEIELLNSLE